MTIQAGVLPELQLNVEIPWPMKREGKQVYAKLLNFGAFPGPYGLKGKLHEIPDIEWKQISWDHSYISKSSDGQKVSLGIISSPYLLGGGPMPWRILVDNTSIQINMLSNTDYREWDTIVLCLLYTKTSDGAEGGSLIAPGPDGMVLTSRDNGLVWEEAVPSEPFERYDLCEFYYFRQPRLRPGFQPANGMLLENAAELYPRAWEYLQSEEGQALCVSEEEWQAMTRATWATLADGTQVGWEGVGGAPFYALHMDTGALRLPDLRGMYPEVAGFDGLEVGGVHGDAERPKSGRITSFSGNANSTGGGAFRSAAGMVYLSALDRRRYGASTDTDLVSSSHAHIDVSLVAPTANKNQPRAWGALGCVYLGAPR